MLQRTYVASRPQLCRLLLLLPLWMAAQAAKRSPRQVCSLQVVTQASGCVLFRHLLTHHLTVRALPPCTAGAFAGYQLQVMESHQSTKVDVSGTAKAIVQSFQKLGIDYNESKIKKIREKGPQLEVMSVPEEALAGHAFHTYDLTSPDGSVNLMFKHNVMGRSTYAEGTVDAVIFLHKKIQERAQQKVYNMIDVLKEGSLRRADAGAPPPS